MARKSWNKKALRNPQLRSTRTATRLLILQHLVAEHGDGWLAHHSVALCKMFKIRRETLWRNRQQLIAARAKTDRVREIVKRIERDAVKN